MIDYQLDFTCDHPTDPDLEIELSAGLRLIVDWHEWIIEDWTIECLEVRGPDGVWREHEPSHEIVAKIDDELWYYGREILMRVAEDGAWDYADHVGKMAREG